MLPSKEKPVYVQQIIKIIQDNPEILSYIFFDGVQIGKKCTYAEAEKREPNYFLSLYTTFFKELVNCDQLLDITIVENLHQSCMKDVKKTTYDDEKNHSIINRYDTNKKYYIPPIQRKFVSLGLPIDQIKEDSSFLRAMHYMVNLSQYGKKYAMFKFRVGLIKKNEINEYYENNDIKKLREVVALSENDEFFAERMNKFAITFNLLDTDPNEKIDTIMIDLIRIYEENIVRIYQTNQFDNEKKSLILEQIINLVLQLARLHPFWDGNCRTFSMMLLNLQLIRHGMEPTFQNNPNLFEVLAPEDLKKEILIGMERFKNYLRAHTISPPYKNLQLEECNEINWEMPEKDKKYIFNCCCNSPIELELGKQQRLKEEEKYTEQFLADQSLIRDFLLFYNKLLNEHEKKPALLRMFESFRLADKFDPHSITLDIILKHAYLEGGKRSLNIIVNELRWFDSNQKIIINDPIKYKVLEEAMTRINVKKRNSPIM